MQSTQIAVGLRRPLPLKADALFNSFVGFVADITVIFNPSAHSERAHKVVDAMRALGGEANLRFTERPEDARLFAAEAARDGARIVVAAGGDGTVNEVANGIAGTPSALGVLPLGTMNVFAKELGLPTTLTEAWAVILGGILEEIDLPIANDQHFVQLAGVGLDAQIVKETTWKAKKRFGPLSYLFSAAHVAQRPPPKLKVTCNGRTISCSFVLVGNGRFYGSKIVLFPDARLDDGLFDVVVFKDLGFWDIARYVGGVFLRRHTGLAGVEYLQTKEATVSCDTEVPVELDGELTGITPVKFRVGARLKVVVGKAWPTRGPIPVI